MRLLTVATAIFIAMFFAAHARADDDVALVLDQAKVMRLPPGGVHTLVVGNPLIADAVIGDGRVLILTGKSFGRTNLLFLTAGGDVIAEKMLTVSNAKSSIVTVTRGTVRSTYYCPPGGVCQPFPALGDGKADFDQNLDQVMKRNGASQGVTTSERPRQ